MRGRPLVRDLGPDGTADRLEREPVLVRQIRQVIEVERHQQDGERRRTQHAADDVQVATIAGALSRRGLLALLLPKRLQLTLGSRHIPALHSLRRDQEFD